MMNAELCGNLPFFNAGAFDLVSNVGVCDCRIIHVGLHSSLILLLVCVIMRRGDLFEQIDQISSNAHSPMSVSIYVIASPMPPPINLVIPREKSSASNPDAIAVIISDKSTYTPR